MKTKLTSTFLRFRSFFMIIALFLLTLFVYNCSTEPRIKILGENSSNLQAMEALKSKYEAQSGVKIDFRPNTFEDTDQKAHQDFDGKTGLYDIILQVNFSLAPFVRKNWVYSMDELLTISKIAESDLDFEKYLFPNAWKEVGYYYEDFKNSRNKEIKKIGYPFATNTMLLVYNKKMFDQKENKDSYREKYNEELVVPTTWEQYARVANFFTDKEKNTYGVCMQGAADGWLYYEYCDFLYGMGGRIFDKEYGWQGDKDTPILITSDIAKEATKFYLDMKPYNAGNYMTTDANEQIDILKRGNVAMGIVWSDYLHRFIKDGRNALDFGFAPIPGNTSPLAGGCFYVNRNSKNPEEAMKYIINLMQPENQIELAKKGLCSPLRTTYEDEEVKRSIPYSDALKESLERGVYMFEAGPESNLVMNIITHHIQKLWNGDSDIDTALHDIESDIYLQRKEAYQ